MKATNTPQGKIRINDPHGSFFDVIYKDAKADSLDGFGLISNFMWRRAYSALQPFIKSGVTIQVIDPCAGAGKLLFKGDKSFHMVAYEDSYPLWMFGNSYAKQYDFTVDYKNYHFESCKKEDSPFDFHLAISIPYLDRDIMAQNETNPEYLVELNYQFYVLNKSIDLLISGGIGVFCLPVKYVESAEYIDDVQRIMQAANIISVESYSGNAIIVLQKK